MVHKIDGTGATSENEFTEGDPILGVPYTWVTDDWLNMLQRELVAVVEAAGLNPTKGNDSQLLESLELLGFGAFANKAANSLFEFWQRYPSGVSPAITSAAFIADRWVADPGSSGSALIFPQAQSTGFLFGQASRYHGEFPAKVYRHQQTVASSATRAPAIFQRIPDVRTLAGADVTISFYAACDSGTRTITPKLTQQFGDGISASADVVTQGTPITIGTVPAWYQQTLSLPSISGKTIQLTSDPESWLELRLDFVVSATYTIDLWNVRLESGTKPRPNLWLPTSVEQVRCEAFFEKSHDREVSPYISPNGVGVRAVRMDVPAGGNLYNMEQALRTTKRFKAAACKVTWFAGASSTPNEVIVDGTAYSCTSANENPHSTGFPVAGSAPTGQRLVQAHYTVEAEFSATP